MEAFNLNVDAYTPKELENLYGLRNNYTESQVKDSYSKLVKQLKKNKDLGLEKQKDILFFLDTVSNKLVNLTHPDSPVKGTWSEEITPTQQYGSNFVITNANSIAGKKASNTEGRIAVTGAAPPGYLNPINVRTIMQPISIDSRFRPNYYTTLSTNFSVMLPETQKKVISMRVATIEMPMTWYSFTNSYGNTSFLVIADPSGQTWNRAYDGGKWTWDYSDRMGNIITTASGLARSTSDGFFPIQPAWLVTIPNGNYEVTFLDKNKSMPIDAAINDALSTAKPGAIDRFGKFGYEVSPGPSDPTTVTGSIGYLNAGVPLGATLDSSFADIRYVVGRGTGKSVFASPGYASNIVYGGGGMPFVPGGINNVINPKKIVGIRFNIFPWGDLDMNTSIQTKLGWQIGFRAAQYVMGKGSWEGTGRAPDDSFTCLRLPEYENDDASGIPISAISEGICMPTGPRYGFLSIDDHCNSHGPHYLVAYSKSTLDDNLITRFNLSAEMDKTGVYKDNSDPGISTQLNRTREYFGPVNIQKLEIKVYDEYGRVLDLNNMDWSFTLAFEKLYD